MLVVVIMATHPNRRYRILLQVLVPRRYIGRATWIRPILDMPDTTLLTAKTSELILQSWGGDFTEQESTQCFYRDAPSPGGQTAWCCHLASLRVICIFQYLDFGLKRS